MALKQIQLRALRSLRAVSVKRSNCFLWQPEHPELTTADVLELVNRYYASYPGAFAALSASARRRLPKGNKRRLRRKNKTRSTR